MSDVTLTASMRSNLLALKNTQKLFDLTETRLSTGLKVNTALDNPSAFFTAQSLNSRANALTGLMDSMGQAVQTLKAADQGLTTLNTMAEQAKSLVNSALDTKDTATYKTGSVQVEANTDLGKIGGIADTDTFSVRIGKSNELVSTLSVTKDQKLSTLGVTEGTDTVTFRLQNKDGSGQDVNVAITTGMTTEGLLNAVQKAFGYDKQGNNLVNVGIVDGKMTITAADKNMSILALDKETTDKTSVLGFDIGTSVDMSATVDAATKAAAMKVITSTAGVTASTTVDGTTGTPTLTINGTAVTLTGVTNGQQLLDAINDQVSGVTASFVSDGFSAAAGKGGILIQANDGVTAVTATFGGTTTDFFGTGVAPAADAVVTGGSGYPSNVASAYELMGKLNAIDGVTASINDAGRMVVTVADGKDLVITDTSGSAAGALGLAGVSTNGSTVRANYAAQYDELLVQMNQLIRNDDTGYKGINLLNGDNLTVNFNESRTSTLLVAGQKMDTKSLGLQVAQNSWKTSADINEALEQIEGAISDISSAASSYGQNLSVVQTRQEFTENMINILTTGADNLTLADMNEEAANMLALQTRQQLATNALSLSSQAQQGVLRLF